MAANPFSPSHVGVFPFDIYNDPALPARNTPNLPGGHCNFVDLSPGANGSRCGCRRFWSRQVLGSPLPDQAGWCMCNHHACYHDDAAQDPTPVEVEFPGQENERPRTGREPLSPMMGMAMPLTTSTVLAGMDFPGLTPIAPLSFIQNDSSQAGPHGGAAPTPRLAGSMPDTLAWGDFVHPEPDATPALTPNPPQSFVPSQTASVVSSVRGRYLRPFAGKGLQTLGGVPESMAQSPLRRETWAASPTAPFVPSAPVMEAPAYAPQTDREASVTQPPRTMDHDTQAFDPRSQCTEVMKNLSDTVSGHAQRLDRLETVSFSTPAHEECQEKHEHLDLRVVELENRVDEVEKLVNDSASVIGRRSDKVDDAASQAGLSIDTSVASHTSRSQELLSQLQLLQEQVTQLQSAVPSSGHPWEVEVVFLPFPLMKIWLEQGQFKAEPSSLSDDEWTQLPMTNSATTLRSQSPFFGDWAPPDHNAEWLLPKACADKSVTDKRLRSRGLIKTVSVKGSDARSVQVAVHVAFGSVFREMQLYARPNSTDLRLSRFMGLQSAWVPLRKIHKDSRLRFLSPAEMVTPAMWDVPFLSSVMMRSAKPRLFVTHADAYLQDSLAYETGWSWQRLRGLTPSTSDGEDCRGPENDREWAWNEQLDTATKSHTLSKQPQDGRRLSHSPVGVAFPEQPSRRASSPMVSRGSSPMLRMRRGSRPLYIRTGSVPVQERSIRSPSISRRRIASNGYIGEPSTDMRAPSQSGVTKRRRTRSPSYGRNTPRWTASPSPFPLGLGDRQVTRPTTPFAYATPHSNAPLQEMRTVRGGSAVHFAQDHPSDAFDHAAVDVDMGMYQSPLEDPYDDEEEDDDEDDDDNSLGSLEVVTHAQADAARESQHAQLPEDEPWPGIEDQDNLSDGENIDPQYSDHKSDSSSQPSEYPSTQRAWPADDEEEFRIHEDEDGRPGK
ncbi:hypothetical protein S7711_00019 [Stachybotrys chartarum IBT 7711]|uniref:Uncharacterized protein n=1 Tax=Stachybotrys chartarum (strain CBS 109288 / IBT 7711) TaxID=1280523 RepID=A0A084B369_STACB|nr:hypothetical protein S7711_00019 [Stachybotrys chartarum IBT 7711]